MPFSPNDQNINKNGRPKGSLNESTKVKQQIQTMLSDLIHNELATNKLLATLDKASPSARLRFYSDIMPFIIAKVDKDETLTERPESIEVIIQRNRDETPIFSYCPTCKDSHQPTS